MFRIVGSKSRVTVMVVLTVASLWSAVAAAEPTRIAWRWAPEQSRVFEMTREMNRTLVAFTERKTRTVEWMSTTWTATEVDDAGVATIEIHFDRTRYRSNASAFGELFFDSDQPDVGGLKDLPLIRPLAGLVGRSITVRMAPTGELLELEGLDAIVNEALTDTGADSEMKESMRRAFGDEGMRQWMESVTRIAPAEPVESGHEWATEVKWPIQWVGVVTGVLNNKVRSIEDTADGRRAEIISTSEVSAELRTLDLQKNNFAGRPKGVIDNSKAVRRATFEIKRGAPSRSEAGVLADLRLTLGTEENSLDSTERVEYRVILETPKEGEKEESSPES
ncbi:MAG: DUF6263 family protein [Phycisphaerales bacterium]